jgi:cytochrome P450
MISKVSLFEANRLYRQNGPEFARLLQQKYGNLFCIGSRLLPWLPYIYFVLDAEDSYQLLVKQKPMLEKPSIGLRMLKSSFGEGLFTNQGDHWRRQRKLMQPAFHHGQIGRYAAKIVHHTEAMLTQWQAGMTITIDDVMHALTFTIVVDALFSADASEKIPLVQQAMHNLSQGLAKQNQSILLALLPDWAPAPALRQKQRGAQALDRLVRQRIAERRVLGQADSPPDLLSTLLFTRDEDTDETMSDQQLRDELVTLYIAGHETTAVLLNWTWVLLSQHPDVATQLQAELGEVLGGRSPTFDDLPQLSVTNAIIKEVLRLYPPAWVIFREAGPGLTIRDEVILDNSAFAIFPYAVHRDDRWYEEPLAFHPARWLADIEQSLPKGAYFPFGLGPRTCIGNGFAQMEAQLILATIAQYFRLQQLNEAKMVPAMTLSFAEPVRIRLQKIETGD